VTVDSTTSRPPWQAAT